MEKRKFTALSTALLMGALTFTACDDDKKGGDDDGNAIRVESVEWKSDLKSGKQIVLGDNSLNVANRVDILPKNATDQTQTFKSSNTSVATVSAEGQVTTLSLGATTITVTVDEVSDDFVLTVVDQVREPDIPVTGIDVADKNVRVGVDLSKTLVGLFTVMPLNATDRSVSYRSDNTSVVTVDESGTITGVSMGTAKVTVTSNWDNEISEEFDITVSQGDHDRTGWRISISPLPEVNNDESNLAYPLDGDEGTFLSIIKPGRDWSGAVNPSLAEGGYVHFIVDMGQPRTVNYFRICHREKNTQLRFWKISEVSGSNDLDNFETIQSFENFDRIATDIEVIDAKDESKNMSPNLPIPDSTYRYIRFMSNEEGCYQDTPNTGHTVQVAEIYLGLE